MTSVGWYSTARWFANHSSVRPVVAQRVRHLPLRALGPEPHRGDPVRRVLGDVLLHERLLPAVHPDHRQRPVRQHRQDAVARPRRGSRRGRAWWRPAPSKSGWSRFVSGTPSRSSSGLDAIAPRVRHRRDGYPVMICSMIWFSTTTICGVVRDASLGCPMSRRAGAIRGDHQRGLARDLACPPGRGIGGVDLDLGAVVAGGLAVVDEALLGLPGLEDLHAQLEQRRLGVVGQLAGVALGLLGPGERLACDRVDRLDVEERAHVELVLGVVGRVVGRVVRRVVGLVGRGGGRGVPGRRVVVVATAGSEQEADRHQTGEQGARRVDMGGSSGWGWAGGVTVARPRSGQARSIPGGMLSHALGPR